MTRWFANYLSIIALISAIPSTVWSQHQAPEPAAVTILCYLNGDNDLSEEVLYTLDMMETVGSSDKVQVIALVDGHRDWLGPYSNQWDRTRLLRLERDSQIGTINSVVLEEWGEADLGRPETLERFIRVVLDRYPSQKYFFYTFAHSRGVIDTQCFSVEQTGKTLSISRDTTSQSQMRLDVFHSAIKRGLNGRRFELMVLFSCLANMVEVGYALSDVADYLVSSQDEIRLLNQPPGSYQIRGLRLEEMIALLHQTPSLSVPILGRFLVDRYMADYEQDSVFTTESGEEEVCRFSAGMALVDGKAVPPLVRELDQLAHLMLLHADQVSVVKAMATALATTQRFASFLNLEYYDLTEFVQHLYESLDHPDIKQACQSVLGMLKTAVVLYERHTDDCSSGGMSVYLSNPLVPENIFQAHQSLYAKSRFARNTRWDEMIRVFRQKIKSTSIR